MFHKIKSYCSIKSKENVEMKRPFSKEQIKLFWLEGVISPSKLDMDFCSSQCKILIAAFTCVTRNQLQSPPVVRRPASYLDDRLSHRMRLASHHHTAVKRKLGQIAK